MSTRRGAVTVLSALLPLAVHVDEPGATRIIDTVP